MKREQAHESEKTPVALRARIARLALRLLAYAAVAFLVFNLVGIYAGSHMARLRSDNVPLDFGMNAEDISFQTADGLTLRGWYIPAREKAPVILFLHGLGTVKGDLVPMGRFLHQKGYALLFFDFRACGESDGSYSSFGCDERLDLQAAIEYLRTRDDADAERLGLIGVSMGSAVAATVAAKEPAVKALVLDSAFAHMEDVIAAVYHKLHMPAYPFARLSKWLVEVWFWNDFDRMAPISAVEQIAPRGILIISGGKDPIMRPPTVRRLYDAATQPKELWPVPEAGHVGAYEARTREYEQKVTALFERFLPVRTPRPSTEKNPTK